MIMLDLSDALIKKLISLGWESNTGYRQTGNTRVLSKGRRTIAIIHPLRLPDGRSSRFYPEVNIEFEVERFFDKLIRILDKIGATDVFLPGGGNIPIPKSLIDYCLKKGIKIHILTYEDIESEAAKLVD